MAACWRGWPARRPGVNFDVGCVGAARRCRCGRARLPWICRSRGAALGGVRGSAPRLLVPRSRLERPAARTTLLVRRYCDEQGFRAWHAMPLRSCGPRPLPCWPAPTGCTVTSSAPPSGWEPPVDLLETANELIIIAALPGVRASRCRPRARHGEIAIVGTRRLPAALPGPHPPHGAAARAVRAAGGAAARQPTN